MAAVTMKERIKIEQGELKPSEVTELILDMCKASGQVDGLTEEYCNVEMLSLINCGLNTLKGFPALPKLRHLELSDNRLTGELEHLKGCPSIANLKISNNRIAKLDDIEPLKSLKELESLDLIECPISDLSTYRDDVFSALPNLKFLNGIDKEGNQEPDSDEDFELGEEEEDLSDMGSEDEEDDEDDEDEDEEEEEEEEENGTVKEDTSQTKSNGPAEQDESVGQDEPVAKKIKLADDHTSAAES